MGAPKCGTTSLYFYLREHPEIFMSVPKEPLYFCKDLIDHKLRTKTEAEYLSFFAGAAGYSRVGEASTWYLYSSRAAAEIKQFAPEARIIIMLRKIPDAIYSLHSQYLYLGNESVDDFTRALRLEPLRKQGKAIPEGAYFPRGLIYTEVFLYARQILRYLREFDREQIVFITLDELRQSAEQVYKTVLEFLGLESYPKPQFEKHNSNSRFKTEFMQEFVKKIPGDTKETIRDFLPVKPCMQALEDIRPLMVKNTTRPPMSDRLYRKLVDQSAAEVRRVEKLIDKDLSGWLAVDR